MTRMLRLCHVAFQLALAFVAIRSDQDSSNSSNDRGDGGDVVGDFVFASILIMPSVANDTNSTFGNQSEPFLSDKRSGRTQLLYNCTSSPSLWNLLEDSNMVKLETFQEFPSSDSNTVDSSSGSSSTTSDPRNTVAVAVVQIADCSTIETTLTERPVVLNSFFGADFPNSSPSYLYITNSALLSNSSGSASLSSGACRLRLEMAQATLPDVYPECKIRFESTDLDSILLESPTTNDEDGQPPSRRLEDASSFDFIRDPSCTTECGADDLDHNTCYAPALDGRQTVVQCKMQFYAKNSACNFECGDETGSPYNLSALDVSQCYSCYSESKYGCPSGYIMNSAGCCRVLSCPAMVSPGMSSPRSFTLNLQPNRSAVTNPSMMLYTSGDCSDPTNPSNDCCRITCENCFINMSIASLYAEVDVYSSSVDYTATEMKLVGNSAINVKVVSPNGCKLESTTLRSFRITPLSIPLGLTSLEVDFTVDFVGELAIKPHGSSAQIGVTFQIEHLSAGSINSHDFVDKKIVFQGGEDISKSGIHTVVELSVAPTVRANLVFLDLASIGVQTGFPTFVRLESIVKYPEQFPALATPYLDDSSQYRGGDCSKSHFMEYRGVCGYQPVEIASYATIEIPWDSDLLYEKPLTQYGADNTSSLFSGCVSSEYNAVMLLNTAANAVTSATTAKVSSALQKILMYALQIPDIDPNFLKIPIYSSGQITVTIAVPPSVADMYPIPSELETQFYQVARTAAFADTVSSFVGLSIVAQCQSGFWGASCLSACTSPNCATVTCNSATGVVTACTSCKQGYWGSPSCSNTCVLPQNCQAGTVTCDSKGKATSCTACNDGWWGPTCTKKCTSPQCGDGAITCEIDGTITSCSSCSPGYWGSTCSNSCSSPHCPVESASCDDLGSVTSCSSCETGWWGHTCDNQCSSLNCKTGSVSCDSEGHAISCSSCGDGWWGQTCSDQCTALNCKTGKVSCDAEGDTISCSECEEGWWGPTCSNECTSSQCTAGNASCDSTGNVVSCSSCDDGWWGQTCSEQCTALSCKTGNVTCDAAGDTISCSECEDGWWGPTCNNTCESPGCEDGGMTCNLDDGSVTWCSSCNTGYWGSPTCNNACESLHCPTGSASCDFEGNVLSCGSCETGWWGQNCSDQCIALHCTNDAISCDLFDGTVSNCSSCEDGYYGSTCEDECELPAHCESSICEQQEGGAVECSSCEDGYYGSTCESKCSIPQKCQSSRCEPDSGEDVECLVCDDGFFGPKCEGKCSVPENCNSTRCDISGETTQCLTCTTGWWHAICREPCVSSHCIAGSATCHVDDGAVTSCDSCEDSWWVAAKMATGG
ncbi:uncharacterized protein PITG_20332 [Phytophthora infestans T30-4]|uniref:EGF-like domain-containing protein n=1 Tax=Phytophthora infestans (strain T30-4) TaxID=403677 RepID=D0P219_PHYIT|nr:uncharacterized protein PITG_20332 [Phytophthora infestans T30-4]EEY55165.1 conserved hypothetical protein [Phytophthora infestans T30-4]|eukprot:XP_002895664.1 conserved hypothetical protein [Phytophthora infestans T30-4]